MSPKSHSLQSRLIYSSQNINVFFLIHFLIRGVQESNLNHILFLAKLTVGEIYFFFWSQVWS